MASEQLKMIVEMLKSRPARADLSIEEWRAEMETARSQISLAKDVRCQPVDAGGVPAEWISTPQAVEERIVYYLHGGGYARGSIKAYREMVSRLSRSAGAIAFAIDYRLAPENPFPAAVEDSIVAYRWLLSTGIDPARLVIAGDSAGGGMTIATSVAMRDAGEPMPAAEVCISPWVDLECLGESITMKARVDPVVTRELLVDLAKMYLGDVDPRTPLASPLYSDLRGLPPLLIQVGTSEVLLDDATRLAECAQSAGVDVVLEPWDDMIHVWHAFAALLPEGQQAIDRIGEFIRKHTG